MFTSRDFPTIKTFPSTYINILLNICLQIQAYVQEWLTYQSLWDLQPDNLYGQLGDDVNKWMECLNDIKYACFKLMFELHDCLISHFL